MLSIKLIIWNLIIRIGKKQVSLNCSQRPIALISGYNPNISPLGRYMLTLKRAMKFDFSLHKGRGSFSLRYATIGAA